MLPTLITREVPPQGQMSQTVAKEMLRDLGRITRDLHTALLVNQPIRVSRVDGTYAYGTDASSAKCTVSRVPWHQHPKRERCQKHSPPRCRQANAETVRNCFVWEHTCVNVYPGTATSIGVGLLGRRVDRPEHRVRIPRSSWPVPFGNTNRQLGVK